MVILYDMLYGFTNGNISMRLKAGERMSMCCDPSGLQAAISVPTFREGTLINRFFGGIII